QQEMARNVLRSERRRVRDVMIPWERVAKIAPDADARALRGASPGQAHARYPVVSADGHLHGIAHLLDLLRPGTPPAARIARSAYFLRADQTVLAALLTLQRRHAPIAVVRDAGRMVGIVTAKDLVEEIVGDLHDL
ncbi:MAG: CBS domain-containing protein, partial [Planctomycetes bacterium]|nr:CBS domain-containing protein [Planctomycetota bacterium]